MKIKTIDGKAPGASENTAFTIGFKMPVRPIDANALCEGRVCNDPVRIAAMCADTLSLNTLRDAIYEDAVAHGLWEEHDCKVAETIAEAIRDGFPYEDPRAVNRSWAMEPIRKEVNELEMSYESEEEYAEELADVVIMCFSVAGKLGIDIDAAIRRKMEINKKRPWKHGKE